MPQPNARWKLDAGDRATGWNDDERSLVGLSSINRSTAGGAADDLDASWRIDREAIKEIARVSRLDAYISEEEAYGSSYDSEAEYYWDPRRGAADSNTTVVTSIDSCQSSDHSETDPAEYEPGI